LSAEWKRILPVTSDQRQHGIGGRRKSIVHEKS